MVDCSIRLFHQKDDSPCDGLLLLHGLTGSPYEFKRVAQCAYERGITVYAPVLPGHCDNRSSLATSTWRDWTKGVKEAFDLLQQDCRYVYVGGLCLGALLALEFGIRYPDLPKGLILYSTPLILDGWQMPAISRLNFLLPFVARLPLVKKCNIQGSPVHSLKDERLRSIVHRATRNGRKFRGGFSFTPVPSMGQFISLKQYVKRNLDRITAPTFALHSREDDVCSLKNIDLLSRELRNCSTKILNDCYHIITLDKESKTVCDSTVAFIKNQNASNFQQDFVAAMP